MQVHNDLDLLPSFKNAVVTIGTFDGVHLGHQQIIAQLKHEAAAIGGETVIITFHPHPRMVVGATHHIHVLTTLNEKIALLRAHGVDHIVIVPFTEDFAAQTPKEYIRDFLVAKFNPHTVIIGYDHRFGKGRKGDYHLLEDDGKLLGFQVKEIPEHVLNNVTISSTRIRSALLHNDIATADSYLGYDYFFEGSVMKGNQLGRTIGYPTANLAIENEEKLIPGNGVYAVEVSLIEGGNTPAYKSGDIYKAMMNIGVRPTVDGKKRTIEVNIFDFEQDIYDKVLRVYVKHYLRGEVKFTGLETLKEQLAKDKVQALARL